MIDVFVELKERLSCGVPSLVVEQAIECNNWFTVESINGSVDAICNTILDRKLLREWIMPYDFTQNHNVGVIMAGNIPLVGFYDLISVLISGSTCYYKTSSKDNILIEWIVSELKDINKDVKVKLLDDDSPLDAIIAMGSDNSNRYFHSKYGNLKALYRGSRTSVAVVKIATTAEQIKKLHGDIFTYWGLGCRNVSHLYIERGVDIVNIINIFKENKVTFSKYLNNYRYSRAEKVLNSETFIDGGFFTLQEKNAKLGLLSEITFSYFENIETVELEINANDSKIQCVVCDDLIFHHRSVPFGRAQMPKLEDAPDSKNTLEFICGIAK